MRTMYDIAIFESILLIRILACFFRVVCLFYKQMKRQELIILCASITNVLHTEENLDLEPLVQTSSPVD